MFDLDDYLVPSPTPYTTLDVDLEQARGTTFATPIEELHDLHEHCRQEIAKANEAYTEHANKDRIAFPELRPGDRVWLSTQNLKTTRPVRKLAERYIGPFPIIERISKVAYKLDLPHELKALYPVFHVSLLEPHHDTNMEGRHQEPPPPVQLEDASEWEVEAVLDCRQRRKQWQYLVKWQGYGDTPDATSWEPASNLENSQEVIKQFHERNPHALQPPLPKRRCSRSGSSNDNA